MRCLTCAASNPAIASLLQSKRLMGRVAELEFLGNAFPTITESLNAVLITAAVAACI